MMLIRGTCKTISDSDARLLSWIMDNNGRMITSKMAVDCGITKSPHTFEVSLRAIRAAVGQDMRFQSLRSGRYMWDGDPVILVPTAISTPTDSTDVGIMRVRSSEEVAEILGITAAQVRDIERRAIRKLKRNPALAEMWRDLIADRKPVRYDPFHEIWLFHVAEEIHQRGAVCHDDAE